MKANKLLSSCVLVVILALALVVTTQPANGQAAAAKEVLKAVGRIVAKNPKAATGAALLVAGGGSAAFNAHLANGEAVYALEFDLKNDASSIRWADIFSKPDVFPMIQVQGMQTYFIPELMQDYSGGRVIWTFKIPAIPGGRDISIFLLDDDSSSDEVWNNILKTRFSVKLNTVSLVAGTKVSFGATGTIQLVDKKVVLDAPDQLCIYTLTSPRFYLAGDWDSEGELRSGGINVGSVKFSQLINK